jgi:hypothetical protein
MGDDDEIFYNRQISCTIYHPYTSKCVVAPLLLATYGPSVDLLRRLLLLANYYVVIKQRIIHLVAFKLAKVSALTQTCASWST